MPTDWTGWTVALTNPTLTNVSGEIGSPIGNGNQNVGFCHENLKGEPSEQRT